MLSMHSICPLFTEDVNNDNNFVLNFHGWLLLRICAYVKKSSVTFGDLDILLRPMINTGALAMNLDAKKKYIEYLHEVIRTVGTIRFYYKESKVIQSLGGFEALFKQSRFVLASHIEAADSDPVFPYNINLANHGFYYDKKKESWIPDDGLDDSERMKKKKRQTTRKKKSINKKKIIKKESMEVDFIDDVLASLESDEEAESGNFSDTSSDSETDVEIFFSSKEDGAVDTSLMFTDGMLCECGCVLECLVAGEDEHCDMAHDDLVDDIEEGQVYYRCVNAAAGKGKRGECLQSHKFMPLHLCSKCVKSMNQ